MRLVNFESELDMDACERFLSSRLIAAKEPGVNWLTAKDGKMFLYYEDDIRTRHGDRGLVKTYFYGRVKRKKDKTIIQGLIFSAPFLSVYLIAASVLCCAFMMDLASVLISIAVVLIKHILERKNRKSINDYLMRVFESVNK